MGVAAAVSSSAQPLTEAVKEAELRDNIERWRKARETYYSIWFGRPLEIRVAQEASDFVVQGYVDRRLPEETFTLRIPVVRAVILTDLEVLLNRAFGEAVRRTYKTIADFFALVMQGDAREVRIDVRDVQNAIKAEDCNLIPCNPKECNPDTCTRRSFQRFAR